MFDIRNYLGRFAKIAEDKEKIKKTVTGIIESVIGIDLTPEQIEVQKKFLRIKADSNTKTIIFMKKQEILKDLKNNPLTASIDRID